MKNKESERTRCEIYSRVVGYLSEVHCWNNGKRAEWGKRKTYHV